MLISPSESEQKCLASGRRTPDRRADGLIAFSFEAMGRSKNTTTPGDNSTVFNSVGPAKRRRPVRSVPRAAPFDATPVISILLVLIIVAWAFGL